MRKIRGTMLGIAIALGIATDLQAQSSKDEGRSARSSEERGKRARHARGHMKGRLLKGVELSAEQRTAVRAIAARYQERRIAMRDSMRTGSQAGRRDSATFARMRGLREAQLGELRATLTAEQRAQFDRNATAMRERGKEFSRGKRGEPGARGKMRGGVRNRGERRGRPPTVPAAPGQS